MSGAARWMAGQVYRSREMAELPPATLAAQLNTCMTLERPGGAQRLMGKP